MKVRPGFSTCPFSFRPASRFLHCV
jgi:hypothetical protein